MDKNQPFTISKKVSPSNIYSPLTPTPLGKNSVCAPDPDYLVDSFRRWSSSWIRKRRAGFPYPVFLLTKPIFFRIFFFFIFYYYYAYGGGRMKKVGEKGKKQ